LVRYYDLLLQEEARPLAIALFDQPSIIIHLGLDQPEVAENNWYQQTGHPYLNAISRVLDDMINLPEVEKLEFLISAGNDPLSNLQIQLDRQTFTADRLPSAIINQIETQQIYSFCK